MARPAAGKATTVLEFDTDALAAREAAVALETDNEILDRLGERFMVLDEMTRAVRTGDVRAMIVSGPPGVGKSYGVEAVLEKADLFTKLSDKKPKYEIVKGSMSSLGLYAKLYEFSAPGSVVVFDDCDGVLMDELSLNILKGALDSGEHRYISWNSDSRLLRNEGIPDRFDFRGAAIFITNINFGMVRSKKLREHLKALESRCHYIDLEMNTMREKMLRIQQVVTQAGMLDRYNFDDVAKAELMAYVEDNKLRLRELSLRMMLKIADLRKSFPRSWQAMARTTCMTK